jgi:hypothetical protein
MFKAALEILYAGAGAIAYWGAIAMDPTVEELG